MGLATGVALGSTIAPRVGLAIIGVSSAVGLIGISKSFHLEIIV